MAAILFGSIGTIVETSELQREAFNRAFEDHDLDWNWSRTEYRELLTNSGGADRIETYAKSRNQKVDARAIHLSKSERFQQMLRNTPLSPREGVSDVIRNSKTNGFKIAFVTTTLRANLDALFESVRSHILKSDFDLVTDASLIRCPKPAGDVYDYALQSLAEDRTTTIAIEDNVDGVTAARSEGLHCFAFPGINTASHDYRHANDVVTQLDFDKLLYQLCETSMK